MHEAAEHDVGHGRKLPTHRVGNVRVIIAMARRPPTRDPVDQDTSVRQVQTDAVRRDNRKRGCGGLHLAIGPPQMGTAGRDPRWGGSFDHVTRFAFSAVARQRSGMLSLDRFADAKLEALERGALRRSLASTDRGAFPVVTREGRRLVSFSCNDYLGLSIDRRVKAAATAAIEAYGTGAGASRLVTGDHPLYRALEARLAALKGTSAACVFGSGYLANIGVLGALASAEDLVVIDELAHACLYAGAKLSGANVLRFRHNDPVHAGALLTSTRGKHRHALIVTETVFSMDGDHAPLAALSPLAARHDAWLMTDDAHGFGVTEHAEHEVPLQMGTLSKAVGSYGGYCCASELVVALLKTRARPLVYSTALPPATLAAALAALEIIDADPNLVAAPLRKAELFTRLLGLPLAQSPIVPVIIGEPDATLAVSATLAGSGFLVTAIRPPTVPPGTARLRFAFSACHADDDIRALAGALQAIPAVAASLRDQSKCLAYS